MPGGGDGELEDRNKFSRTSGLSGVLGLKLETSRYLLEKQSCPSLQVMKG